MKKIKVLILLFLAFFGLVACGKQDINQFVLVSAIGFDKDEEAGGFKMVAQIVNRNILVPDPPQITPVFVVTVKGKTVFECIRNLNDLLPNKIYLINLQLLAFSEDIAKEGIKDFVHFFVNYSEAQHGYNVLITKGITVEDFFAQISVFSIFPIRILISKLETAAKEFGFAKKTFVDKLYQGLMSDTESLLLSSVEVHGKLEEGETIDQNKKTKIPTEIKISDMAVFDGDKLVGWLDRKESISYNFVMGEIENTVVVVEGEQENQISNIVKNVKSNLKVEIVDNKPKVKIDIKFDAYVIEDTKGMIDLDLGYLEVVKQQLEKKAINEITKCIEKSQKELDIDIFCIANKLYKKHPNWWRENKDKFKEMYKDIEFEVIVKPNIRRLYI